MSEQPKSRRLRLAVTVRQSEGYWVATTGKLDAYGTGETSAEAVESCLEMIVERARMFRAERAVLGPGPFADLNDWERWCDSQQLPTEGGTQ